MTACSLFRCYVLHSW